MRLNLLRVQFSTPVSFFFLSLFQHTIVPGFFPLCCCGESLHFFTSKSSSWISLKLQVPDMLKDGWPQAPSLVLTVSYTRECQSGEACFMCSSPIIKYKPSSLSSILFSSYLFSVGAQIQGLCRLDRHTTTGVYSSYAQLYIFLTRDLLLYIVIAMNLLIFYVKQSINTSRRWVGSFSPIKAFEYFYMNNLIFIGEMFIF